VPPRAGAWPEAWRHARDILAAGVSAADPHAAIARHLVYDSDARELVLRQADGLPEARLELGDGRLLVVAAGKAAVPMAEAAEGALAGAAFSGFTVAPHGARTSARLHAFTVFEAGHPLPDPGGLLAARRAGAAAARLRSGDVLLVLLSGGASAMLCQPEDRISLVDMAGATSSLLGSGAPIHRINGVRAHLGRLQGGGLARAAWPARTVTLALSDVPGDAPASIGGGPTAADPTTFADAVESLKRMGLWDAEALPASVAGRLRSGLAGQTEETAKPGEPAIEASHYRIVGSPSLAADAAAARARELGYAASVITSCLQGEAREVGRMLAAVGAEIALRARPVAHPGCAIFAGESTVTLRRLGGEGGRNRELVLAGGIALAEGAAAAAGRPGSESLDRVVIAALATDGVDGAPGEAGAVADATLPALAAAAGLDAREALDMHDSGPLFRSIGAGIETGPTGTNASDLALVLAPRPPAGSG